MSLRRSSRVKREKDRDDVAVFFGNLQLQIRIDNFLPLRLRVIRNDFPGELTFAIVNVGAWKLEGADIFGVECLAEIADVAFDEVSSRMSFLRQFSGDGGFVFDFVTGNEQQNDAFARIGALEFGQFGQLFDARLAPGRPKIDHDDFALVFGDGRFQTRRRHQINGGRGVRNVGRAR